jgi:hypothetical protein
VDGADLWLKSKVEAGEPIEAPPSGELVISGSLLRELLLGDDLTSAGIVIRGQGRVIIKGDSPPDSSIDLSYLAGREGGPLRPLVLDRCRLDGKLRLTGSHFAFLSLDGCAFSRIDADHCQVDSHCRLINLRPFDDADKDCVAHIRMVAARIDGTADMRNSKLRAPSRGESTTARSRADHYALSLASAEIAGRLLLDDGFEALGGVSLYQASIGNSLSIRTAKLESRRLGTPALDAQELRLAGSFLWSNPLSEEAVDANDWHVAGEVVLRNAQIGGDCSFEQCRWAGIGAPSLRDGNFVDHISGGIDLRFARVKGQLAICAGCQVAQGNAPPPRRKEEDWLSGIFGPSLDAWKAQFEKGVRIECGARFAGPVFLNGTDIGHELIFRGDVTIPMPPIALPSVPEALDLSGARIRGLVRIWGDFSGCLRMHGASVDGTVELQELIFDCPPLIDGDPEQDVKRGLATLLDLSATRITGTLHIGNVRLVGRSRKAATGRMRLMALGGKVRTLYPYPSEDGRLQDFVFEDGSRATLFLSPRGPELFEGTPEQFLDLSPHALPLATPSEAKAFLTLFFSTVAGTLGPSREAEIAEPKPLGDGWIAPGCRFLYGGFWYKADVRIQADGEVWWKNDCPIPRMDRVGSGEPERIGPFVLDGPSAPPVEDEPFDPTWLVPIRAAVAAYFENRHERPLVFDLRGVFCRSFNDMQGMAWESLGPQAHWRLLLDGIDFVQFEEIDPKGRSRRDPKRMAIAPLPAPTWTAEPPHVARRRRILMLLTFVRSDSIRGWRGIDSAAGSPSYSPHPFQVFAKAYSLSGNHFLAVDIVKVQRRLQWTRAALDIEESIGRRRTRIFKHSAFYAGLLGLIVLGATLRRGDGSIVSMAAGAAATLALFGLFLLLALGWPKILVWVGRLFDFTFGFGLKPRRALITAGVCLIAGIIVTYAFNDFRPVPASAMGGDQAGTRVQVAVEGCNTVTDTLVDRAIYAFDVFVPLIDIRQECAFVIDESAWHLRLLKSLYATLGWLVISLMLLTFSGVLRRDMQH